MRQTPKSKQIPIDVAGSSSFGRYQKISSAKTYNMYISEDWLINTAGWRRIYDLLPAGEGRGLFHSVRGDFLLAVVNSSVFRIDNGIVVTFIGNLSTASGEVFMDENLSSQVCIVDGINAYIYNHSLSPNLTIQAVAPLVPKYVDYHNSFFLFGNGDTTSNGSAWYIYQFASPTTISLVTSLALQTKPDYAIAVLRLPGQGNNILVFGTSVCEIWTQVDTIQFYRRNSTINIDYGTASVSTISTSDKYVAWLAINESNSPVIMVYTGQTFGPISSDGIDYQLSKVQFPDQSTAMFYKQDGHLFYQLTFFNPVDNFTLIYDFTTQKFFNLSDNNLDYHPARHFAYFDNKIYFLSLNNASLYESSTDLTTYNENLPLAVQDPNLVLEIPRVRICETVRDADSSPFRGNSVVITIEQGQDEAVTGISLLGNQNLLITEAAFIVPLDLIITEGGIPMADETSGAGIGAGDLPIPYQPRVDLSVSRDGGITWSNTVGRFLNPVAIRQNILNWESVGACNYLTLKFRFWGTSRFVVTKGVLEVY